MPASCQIQIFGREDWPLALWASYLLGPETESSLSFYKGVHGAELGTPWSQDRGSLTPYSCNDEKNQRILVFLLQNQPGPCNFNRFLVSNLFSFCGFPSPALIMIWQELVWIVTLPATGRGHRWGAHAVWCWFAHRRRRICAWHTQVDEKKNMAISRFRGRNLGRDRGKDFSSHDEIDECEHEMDTWNLKTPVSCKFHGKL